MRIGRVLGPVVSTKKNECLEGEKLLLVQVVDVDGVALGDPVVAVDRVDAGTGELVLLVDEGGSARMVVGDPKSPVRTVIVGVIDEITGGG